MMRAQGEWAAMWSISGLALWAFWTCFLLLSFSFQRFFFFFGKLLSKINLHLKQNIKFRLYKIKIIHTNELFLYNTIK